MSHTLPWLSSLSMALRYMLAESACWANQNRYSSAVTSRPLTVNITVLPLYPITSFTGS